MRRIYSIRIVTTAVCIFIAAHSARADMAPGPPLLKDQLRRQNGVDDCRERKEGATCRDMSGGDGLCKTFTWWWIPGTNERATDGADARYATYHAKCTSVERTVKNAAGAEVKTTAFRCLVCQGT